MRGWPGPSPPLSSVPLVLPGCPYHCQPSVASPPGPEPALNWVLCGCPGVSWSNPAEGTPTSGCSSTIYFLMYSQGCASLTTIDCRTFSSKEEALWPLSSFLCSVPQAVTGLRVDLFWHLMSVPCVMAGLCEHLPSPTFTGPRDSCSVSCITQGAVWVHCVVTTTGWTWDCFHVLTVVCHMAGAGTGVQWVKLLLGASTSLSETLFKSQLL